MTAVKDMDKMQRCATLDVLVRQFHLDSAFLPDPKYKDVMVWMGRPVTELSMEELGEAVAIATEALGIQKFNGRKRIEFELACKERRQSGGGSWGW